MSELESIKKTIDTKSESLIENQNCKYEGCNGSIPNDGYKCDTCGKAPLGGRRPGAGFPEGVKKKKTIDKMRVMKSFRERVQQHADHLFNAQYDLAVGEKYLMVRRRIGSGDKVKYKTEVVTDVEVIKEYIDNPEVLNKSGDDYYYITTRAPSNQALDSLLDRGLGKPTEKIEIEGGFFKADKLIIEVTDDRAIEPERDIIEIESETEVSS